MFTRIAVSALAMVLLSFLEPCNKISPTLIYTQDGQIWKQQADGSEKTFLIAKGERPQWIPGTKTHFAYVERQPGNPHLKLWVAEQDGKNPVALTGFEVRSEYCWSPDGQWIVVAHSKDGNYEIYKIRVSDKTLVRLTNNPATDRSPRWSILGNRIAFVSSRSGRDDVYMMNSDGTGETRVMPQDVPPGGTNTQPAWNSDGTKLAFIAQRQLNTDVWVVDVTSGKVDKVTDDGGGGVGQYYSPIWFTNEFVFFGKRAGQGDTLWRYDVKTGQKSNLGSYLNYSSDTTLSASGVNLFSVRMTAAPGQEHIYRTQHYTGATVDLGTGHEPDTW